MMEKMKWRMAKMERGQQVEKKKGERRTESRKGERTGLFFCVCGERWAPFTEPLPQVRGCAGCALAVAGVLVERKR